MRTVKPHAYGLSAEGTEPPQAYQVAGSHADLGNDWVPYRTNRIISIEILDVHFKELRPDYQRGDTAVRGQVYCE
jgi:hypothetical protein